MTKYAQQLFQYSVRNVKTKCVLNAFPELQDLLGDILPLHLRKIGFYVISFKVKQIYSISLKRKKPIFSLTIVKILQELSSLSV